MFKSLSVLNFDRVCRVCLKEVQNKALLVNIFDVEKEQENKSLPPLFIKLMACAAIQVAFDDEFPRSVCQSCVKILNEMCAFKELIECSDAKLRWFIARKGPLRWRSSTERKHAPCPITFGTKVIQTDDKCSEDDTVLEVPRSRSKVRVENPAEDVVEKESQPHSLGQNQVGEEMFAVDTSGEAMVDNGSQTSPLGQNQVDKEVFAVNTPGKAVIPGAAEPCPIGRSNSQSPDYFTCSICSKTCRSAMGLKSHKKIHNGKSLTCGECGKIFAYKRLLNQHMLTHQVERSFLCSECGKSFKTKAQVKVHSRCHFDDRPFACKICSKQFFQACHRNQHMNVHTGSRPYSCHKCSKQFRNEAGLKGHLRRHDGILPYKCEQCGKQFALKTSVKNHSRLHLGEKQFQCEICDKKFALSSSLRAHMKVHSDYSGCVCDTCGKKFSNMHHLTEHVRIHTAAFYVCHLWKGVQTKSWVGAAFENTQSRETL